VKGDFTRVTFKPEKHYSGVRMQQGRVQLDADWNEQLDIQAHRDRVTAADTIGPSGAPKAGGSFAVSLTPDGNDVVVAAGRFYVDGSLCELDEQQYAIASFPDATTVELAHWPADDAALAPGRWVELAADGVAPALFKVATPDPKTARLSLAADASAFSAATSPRLRTVTTYLTQPDDPSPSALSAVAADRTDLVYLDVWEREVTANEDPALLEQALGGVDTATRMRTVWQVRVQEGVTATSCADVAGWPPGPSGARLSATVDETPAPDNDCLIPASGGYRGLQNRLYRVEVHSNGGSPTYKWSRDNGASAFAIEELVNDGPGGTDRIRLRRLGRDQVLALRQGDSVEVLDDDTVLSGAPGTFAQVTDVSEEDRVVTLSVKVQGFSVGRRARIRRWDGGPIAVAPGTTQTLEDGIEITFAGTNFLSGDHWLFAARTATGDIERLDEAPPAGIRHRFAPLALVHRTAGGGATTIDDCRPTFPPLTAIEAEDVGFDNSTSDLVTTDGEPADNVQEAIDVLAESHTLRHHNAFLHGWGIVSGLKVVCSQDRQGVTVRDGWVIDRAGNDVHIPETELPFLDLVEKFDADETNTTKILKDGKGDAWLAWNPKAGKGKKRFSVEPYSSDWKKELNDRLLDTLLMEFYDDSIKDVQAFFERELTPPPGHEDDPAGPQQEKVAALTNLLAQRFSPQAGQHILLTPREHELLSKFYEGLKEELSLETFCGLFDDARPYPQDFPDGLEQLDTIFGRGQHVRLKLHPGGKEAYSVGPGVNPRRAATTINRWDLDDKRLVEQINPFAGRTNDVRLERRVAVRTKIDTGMSSVQDVAFSPDGKRIYVVATTRNGEDTLFRAGTIGREITWDDVFTICDLKIVSLATTPADPNKVYAIAHKLSGKKFLGDGLYRIDPAALAAGTQPARVGAQFNSVGHLRLTPDGRAWASEGIAGGEASQYVAVRQFDNVVSSANATTIGLGGMTGRDDIAVWLAADGAPADTLYVVAETTTGNKVLLAMRGPTQIAQVPLERTAIRLEPYPPTGMLLMTSEDGYAVRLFDMRRNSKVENFVPTQLGPIAVQADPRNDRVYVLNYLSSTLITAKGTLFAASPAFPVAELAKYRQAAVNAYADLTARFLEYLKDCLCEHLLVANPDTDGDSKLYLCAVSVRVDAATKASRVYKVCNLSRRRYVKSFPAIGHWLSLVPVLPFLDLVIEQFCCWVMPDTFARYSVPDFDPQKSEEPQFFFGLGRARQGVETAQALDALGTVTGLFGKFMQFGKVAADATGGG
jgi:hypothetical protein